MNIEYELQLIEKDVEARGDMKGLEVQKWVTSCIKELYDAMEQQGHSGSTWYYVLYRFYRLAKGLPLKPLTGADDEWNDPLDGISQNKRCGHIFKRADGTAFDSNAKIFSRDGGDTWVSNAQSCVDIAFPYEVPDEPERIILDRKKPFGGGKE